LANLFSCTTRSLGPGRIPGDMLLLPWRVLQSILGRSARVHGGRATQELLGLALVSAHHAKRSSLLSLPGVLVPSGSGLRCLEGAVVSRRIWNRHRDDRVGN